MAGPHHNTKHPESLQSGRRGKLTPRESSRRKRSRWLPSVERWRCWARRMIAGAPPGRCVALGTVGEREQGGKGERTTWVHSVHREPKREGGERVVQAHQPHREPRPAVHQRPSPLPGRWVEPSTSRGPGAPAQQRAGLHHQAVLGRFRQKQARTLFSLAAALGRNEAQVAI